MCEAGGIKHVVLCWLKDADNPANLETVLETSRQLQSIALINDMIVGRPLASDRAIVDDSFDVGVVMDFRKQEDLEQYLVHEEHIRRVKDVLAPQCQRIQVYDITY
jgi:Stress responsive A/B Barrel Domain